MPFYSRKATRIPNFDYSSCNYYFITICTHEKNCIFGTPMQLNRLGRIAEKHILQIPSYYKTVLIDKYVVMPNHIHMVVVLNGSENPPITQIIGQFKSGVTKEIRKTNPELQIWQRSFHDHVIRDQVGYEKIWLYIESNPQCWEKDCFYT